MVSSSSSIGGGGGGGGGGSGAQDAGKDAATRLREEGNAKFKNKEYLKAASLYTQALKLEPENEVLYSNRAAAFHGLNKSGKALADADKCIALKPEWVKGWFRKALVLEAMGGESPSRAQLEALFEVLQRCSQLDPESKLISKMTRDVAKKLGRSVVQVAEAEGGDAAEGELDDAVVVRAESEEAYEKMMEGRSHVVGARASAENGLTDPAEVADKVLRECMHSNLAVWAAEGKVDSACYFEDGFVVGMSKAFESPEVLQQCTGFLREHAAKTGATCSCIAAQKSAIAYPRVWASEANKPHWKFDRAEFKDGLFLQLDEKGGKQTVWFMPLKHGAAVPGEPVELDASRFALTRPLLS